MAWVMTRTAIVVAPGRGTYNRDELGYFDRHHADQPDMLARFDTWRRERGQEPVSALDGAERFSGSRHGRGDNASPLIHACAVADFQAIDRRRFDIIGVTGNSMGWYIALACAGAVDEAGGFELVNTMGTLMWEHMIGGQLMYPYTGDDWCVAPGQRSEVEEKVTEIDARPGHALALSIDLGGMLVLAGNEDGLKAFEAGMPIMQDRYPLRLPNHAGFHSQLQAPVAARARELLGPGLFHQPCLPLVDGRGGIWHPKSSDLAAMFDYTLGDQVCSLYDFAAAIRVAAREFMPDVFIVLGPGTTLGGVVAQSLVRADWRGMDSKDAFRSAQRETPRLLAMGMPEQRSLVV